jgi:hypothetical protein
MKKLKYSLVINILLGFAVIFTSCQKDEDVTNPTKDPTKSKEKSAQAYSMIENEFYKWVNGSYNSPSDFDQLNFASAAATYKEALALDPENMDAQFGAAITEILTAYADPDINSLIKQMDSVMSGDSFNKMLTSPGIASQTEQMVLPLAPAAVNVFAMHKLALTDPPLISKIQQVLRDKFLPRLEYASSRLAAIEANPAFKFTISGKMQGDPQMESVSIYPTEVFLMNAGLHGIRFGLEMFLIYKFELTDYSQSSLLNALQQNNQSFFVLASDGLQRAANCKTNLQGMVTKLKGAINALETISGNKSDAIIKLGNNGIKQADLDTVKTYLNKFETAITQDVSITIDDADTDGNTYTIKVNIGNFFNNPAQNPKAAYLPPYTVEPEGEKGIHFRFNAETYADFNFPDPTMSGMFPGMTNETMKRLMHIDEAFGFKFGGWANFIGGYYGWNPIKNATVKIQTATKTYTKTTDNEGDFEFIIREATQNPEPITNIYINYGDGDIELKAPLFSDLFIQAKHRIYYNIDIPLKPHNLTANIENNPLAVKLNWLVDGSPSGYGTFAIERKIGTGNFEDISGPQNIWMYFYNDYNVTQGVTYQYRVRTADYGMGFNNNLVIKNPFYTNIVTITP